MELHKAHKHGWGADLTIQRGVQRTFFLDIFRQSAEVHPPLPPDSDFKNNFRFKGCQWKFSFSLTCRPFPLWLILTALRHFSHNSNPSMFAGIVSAIWELPGGSGHCGSASPAVNRCAAPLGAASRSPTMAANPLCTPVHKSTGACVHRRWRGCSSSAVCWTVHSC